jgi:23S rRNA pseudouridine1911/1915/1917 synthase
MPTDRFSTACEAQEYAIKLSSTQRIGNAARPMIETAPQSAIVPERLGGMRLDQALADLFPHYSRSRLKDWILAGRIRVDGRSLRPRDRLVGGERVELEAVAEPVSETPAQAIPLSLVHEDEAILVVDKPAGLVVHPGAGNPDRTLQNALLHHAPELAALPRAGIVHRLDKETSGLLVVARTLPAHTALVRALQAREIERQYEAVVTGVMTAGGTIDAPIGRHPTRRTHMSVRDDGRPAVTHYRVARRYRAHTHVHVRLDTGRTHQIRVHLAHIGYPLVGDPQYGRRLALPPAAGPELVAALRGLGRQALHASRLGLAHPTSGTALAWESPLPADLRALLDALDRDAAEHARGR